jgi:hypothetical protein
MWNSENDSINKLVRSFEKNQHGIYVPIPKGKNFLPNPVAVNGIPWHADGENNPKAIGTKAYEEWWDEQFDRCLNGYQTGGIFITGRYYYYLNFQIITGLFGPQYPWIVDLDIEYFLLIDWIKKFHKVGIISLKARRKGLSEKAEGIINHGLRFIDKYRAGISAGQQKYVDGLTEKLIHGFGNTPLELRLNYTKLDENLFQTGYKVTSDVGGERIEGYAGNVRFATMHDKSNKLEGYYFHDSFYEESGHYDNLEEAHGSIDPALTFGSIRKGTNYIFGTAGDISSSSKAFQKFWHEAEKLGFIKFWVPGNRMHYPFMVNSRSGEPYNPMDKKVEKAVDPITGAEYDPIPNLRKYKPEQRIGMEDVDSAKINILKEREKYLKLGDRKSLRKALKSFPLTEEEAWTTGGNNNFDAEILNDCMNNLMMAESQHTKWVLDWAVTKDQETGETVKEFPLRVIARPANEKDKDYNIVYVKERPNPTYKDLDIGGIDSYNQDQSATSDSLGAMYVGRRKDNWIGYQGHDKGIIPIAEYYDRPPRKEIFFDNCLKIAVWYNLIGNVMISAEYDNIINYFKENGGRKFLAPRPRSFESKKSTQEHKYGAKMTSHSKPLALGIAQSWVLDSAQYCVFLRLIKDYLAYDEEKIESDWDGADAWMLILMRIEDMRTAPRKVLNNEEYSENEYDLSEGMPIFKLQNNGEVYISQDLDFQNKKEVWNEDKGGWSSGNRHQDHIPNDPFNMDFDEIEDYIY